MIAAEFFEPSDGFTTAALLDGVPVDVIIDTPYIDAQGIATAAASATGDSYALAHAQEGSVLSAGGMDYRVAVVEPDGSGVTVLRLHIL